MSSSGDKSLDNIPDLAAFGTATLFEALPGIRVLPREISPLFEARPFSGRAFPVYAPPGDNLAVHLALAEAPSGSVLVVATGNQIRKAFWGEVTTEAALARGIRGLVTDGAVRDVHAIRNLGFPVFCAAVAIPGTIKAEEGIRNSPVTLKGIVISPTDWIVGDDDGIVIVAEDLVDAAIRAAKEREQREKKVITELRNGAFTIDLFGLRR